MYRENLKIAASANIVKNASVVGEVEIGEESCVLFGAVLRGDGARITIGDHTNIQDNCTVHTDPGFPVLIGDSVTVGHNAILHGCSVGTGTTIGMGSIVLNGAKIGKECLIGAGSLVLQGQQIPDGSLAMGSPAKVKRALTETERENLYESSREYTEIGRQLKAEGFTI